ncbi:threonine synthase [Paenibacillus guangzhouensis]|uniref:threonine synthase n=1 Tax=Paenibacillus guangzhouensis TaxID=1473112 RepID=UPI002AB3081B|nr:threonine synthase [Paenibacillus guangzhouensis]
MNQATNLSSPCACGGLMEVQQDFRHLDADALKMRFEQRLADRMSVYASGVWRYQELIAPWIEEEFIVTKLEGNTPLYTANDRLQSYAGVERLQFKAQNHNPSGSFKDNGMTIAVSHGISMGYRHFACASTGNTSSSLAMYASWAGANSHVFVPSHAVSMNKVIQTLAYGSNVYTFDGTYDDGIRYLEQEADALGYYVCNSVNPLRIEGQKSIIFEMAHQLQWHMPDWILVPGGALSNATALGKGLFDLFNVGLINRLPRIAVIQAEGASPFHQYVQRQHAGTTSKEFEPVPSPSTIASALNIGNPPSWRKAYRYLTQLQGVTAAVSDEEIMQAKKIIDASGLGCEPASAVTMAGLRQLIDQQVIDRSEHVVCILTGHLLKDTDAIAQSHTSTLRKLDDLYQHRAAISS